MAKKQELSDKVDRRLSDLEVAIGTDVEERILHLEVRLDAQDHRLQYLDEAREHLSNMHDGHDNALADLRARQLANEAAWRKFFKDHGGPQELVGRVSELEEGLRYAKDVLVELAHPVTGARNQLSASRDIVDRLKALDGHLKRASTTGSETTTTHKANPRRYVAPRTP